MRAARGVEVGAAVNQNDSDVHVVSARSPVQWRLGPVAATVVVGVSPRVEQDGCREGGGGEVARPVGGGVQCGTPTAFGSLAADHAARGQVGVLRQEPPDGVQITVVDGEGQFDGYGIATRERQPGGWPLGRVRYRHYRPE